ncbi:MAG: penicillin-binding protein 2 [Chloroflexi bacterium]|nr:penicillin-binding protein 2 [Chloroflexota bacterium]
MAAQSLPRIQLRMRLLQGLILAIGLALGARVFYWQILQWDVLSQRALDQQLNEAPLHARRGDIKTSDGLILARETYLYTIQMPPPRISTPEQIRELAKTLAPALKQSYDAVLAKLTSKEKIVILAKDAPVSVGEAVREIKERQNLWTMEITARPARFYPLGAFAAPLIGFVNVPGSAAYGIEKAKDVELRGIDGTKGGIWNALRLDRIPIELPADKPATNGADITLTLNSRAQRITETELEKAVRDSRGVSGSIVVLEPKTGRVLAMASYPTADLNAFSDPANRSKYINPAISSIYEPGSTFKVMTIACALDAGTISWNSAFDDNGTLYVGGREIHNHDNLAPGRVSLGDVFKMSLNVEAAKISVGLGAERFYQCIRNFGLGAPTRIELASEVAGDMKSVGDGRWHDIDLATNAFGQGIAVTPLQLATAMAAVANQGKLMRPYIIQEIRQSNGNIIQTKPEFVRQAIRANTATQITELLAQSIGAESTNKALVPGYRVAGKTGTASIPIPGGFDANATIASFAGFLPVDDPRLVILVKIDKPQTSEWGSQIASPVFSSLAKQLVTVFGIPPDDVRVRLSK